MKLVFFLLSSILGILIIFFSFFVFPEEEFSVVQKDNFSAGEKTYSKLNKFLNIAYVCLILIFIFLNFFIQSLLKF